MIIYIVNLFPFHYEIIPSIIHKYQSIIGNINTFDWKYYISKYSDLRNAGIDTEAKALSHWNRFGKRENRSAYTANSTTAPIFYVRCFPDTSFKKYMNTAYPHVKFGIPAAYDYCINCTIYPKDIKNIKSDGKHFYICHDVDRSINSPYVYFITPLCRTNKFVMCDVLPYMNEKTPTDIPIYIIQGNISSIRRDYSLLKKILDAKFEHKYLIKLVGRGKLDDSFKKYSNLIVKSNLEFIDYHREFQNAYGILPLISYKSHPRYYTTALTSSINYGVAYKLVFITDEQLIKIYNLQRYEAYNDVSNIVEAFRKSLNAFYATAESLRKDVTNQ